MFAEVANFSKKDKKQPKNNYIVENKSLLILDV